MRARHDRRRVDGYGLRCPWPRAPRLRFSSSRWSAARAASSTVRSPPRPRRRLPPRSRQSAQHSPVARMGKSRRLRQTMLTPRRRLRRPWLHLESLRHPQRQVRRQAAPARLVRLRPRERQVQRPQPKVWLAQSAPPALLVPLPRLRRLQRGCPRRRLLRPEGQPARQALTALLVRLARLRASPHCHR